jgi:hypothetical protein
LCASRIELYIKLYFWLIHKTNKRIDLLEKVFF